ncbi:hypothetical protein VTN02DRAFT_168 [Thermoascus thermophilus]
MLEISQARIASETWRSPWFVAAMQYIPALMECPTLAAVLSRESVSIGNVRPAFALDAGRNKGISVIIVAISHDPQNRLLTCSRSMMTKVDEQLLG